MRLFNYARLKLRVREVNIPNLPTDNLYKFITLAGVVLMVFSLWLVRDNSIRMDEGVSRYNAKSGQFEASQTKLEDSLAQFKATLTSLENAANRAQTPEDVRANRDEIVRFKTDFQAAWGLKNEAVKAKIDADNESDELKRLLSRASDDLVWSKWAYVAGAMLTLAGVLAWYLWHQRYQDALLKAQLVALQNADNNSASSPRLANVEAH